MARPSGAGRRCLSPRPRQEAFDSPMRGIFRRSPNRGLVRSSSIHRCAESSADRRIEGWRELVDSPMRGIFRRSPNRRLAGTRRFTDARKLPPIAESRAGGSVTPSPTTRTVPRRDRVGPGTSNRRPRLERRQVAHDKEPPWADPRRLFGNLTRMGPSQVVSS